MPSGALRGGGGGMRYRISTLFIIKKRRMFKPCEYERARLAVLTRSPYPKPRGTSKPGMLRIQIGRNSDRTDSSSIIPVGYSVDRYSRLF